MMFCQWCPKPVSAAYEIRNENGYAPYLACRTHVGRAIDLHLNKGDYVPLAVKRFN